MNPYETTAYERLCDELRRLADVYETTTIQVGHRALAAAIGCSAARIPDLMARLENQRLIAREPFKNCYLIDVARLIDQGVIDQDEALIDQGVGYAVETAITPDRSPLIDHPMTDREMAHQAAASGYTSAARSHVRAMVPTTATAVAESVAVAEGGDARGGIPPAAQLMAELGANPRIIRDAYAARPDWTPNQVRQRWEYDQRRIAASDGKLSEGVFFTALRCGELAPIRTDPARPLDPESYAADPAYQLGSAMPDESARRNALYRDAHWRAVDLLGPGAAFGDMRIVVEALVDGATDDQALATLAHELSEARS